MSAHVTPFEAGGYRFIDGVFQYSAGVAALPGYRIERATFRERLPLNAGFAAVERFIAAAGRPLTAFCACELRSPAPFTEDGFRAFNEVYVGTLTRWGIFDGTTNPVARSNVCPAVSPPPVPSFHAFSFTVADAGASPSFVIAGSGEAEEGKGNYRDHIVRRGDTSEAGLEAKARFVLTEMERRMAALGFGWHDVSATQVYTVHDFHPFLADEIVRRGAARAGLTWHYDRPPVQEIEFEMDCRRVDTERVIAP
jgi:hypothetical protein